jgi:hypothetical protein
MKQTAAALCILAGFFSHASLGLSEESSVDTLLLKNGSTRTGKILALDENVYRIEIRVDGRPVGSVTIPRADVEAIQFAENPAVKAFLAGDAGADILEAARLWGANMRFLKIPRSPASRIGRRYAEILLQSSNPQFVARALEIFTLIEKEAWDADERAKGREGRLRAMIASGQAKEAVEEAMQIARDAEEPSLLIQAKYILATDSDKKLQQLVEENPRWNEDVFVRPERMRLFNDALDNYLFAPLFHGSESEFAARGLYAAAQVYLRAEQPEAARELLTDILDLYPGTPQEKPARSLLEKLPPPVLKTPPVPQASATSTNERETSSKPADEHPTKTPKKKRKESFTKAIPNNF